MKKSLISFLVLVVSTFVSLESQAAIYSSYQGGISFTYAFPDVCKTPGNSAGFPIPYPDTSTSNTPSGKKSYDSSIGATKVPTGDGAAFVTIDYDLELLSSEASEFRIYLADPETGNPLGADYEFSSSESSSGEIVFNLTEANFSDFRIVFSLVGEETEQPLVSTYSITDMEIAGVYFLYADRLGTVEHAVATALEDEITPALGSLSGVAADFVAYAKKNASTGYSSIYGQHLSVDGSPSGVPINISNLVGVSTHDLFNDISGSRVVYSAFDSPTADHGRVMFYDMSSGASMQVSAPDVELQEAKIHGDVVIWVQGPPGERNLYYYNVGWPQGTPVLEVPASRYGSASELAVGYEHFTWTATLSDGSTLVLTCETVTASNCYAISLDARRSATWNDWVVYQVGGANTYATALEAVNLQIGEFIRIAEEQAGVVYSNPDISDGFITYGANRAGNWDIYLYQIGNGKTYQLTTHGAHQRLSNILGNKVAYVDFRSSQDKGDIYLSMLAPNACVGYGSDEDGDGFCQTADNCPIYNPDQLDGDNDGIGNACDHSPVYSDDETFSHALKDALGVQTLEEATYARLYQATELNMAQRGLTTIEGLEGAVNLNRLYLSNNNLENSAPLAGLTSLKWLDLSNNHLTDISPLAQLTQLTHLWLHNNIIWDISPLADMKGLQLLFLHHNDQISDISALAGMAQLGKLHIAANNITDLSPLSALAQLSYLHLNQNRIADISPLANKPLLSKLYLGNNRIKEIDDLSSLTGLVDLAIQINHIGNIAPLSRLMGLQSVALYDNCITNFSPVDHVSTVQGVDSQRPDTDGDFICDNIDSDDDNDFIWDNVDLKPLLFSSQFSDVSLGGTTAGIIRGRGNVQFAISELRNPSGVLIESLSVTGKLKAVLDICPYHFRPDYMATINIGAGDVVKVTCGSAIIETLSGSIEASFQGDDAVTIDVVLNQGNGVTFDESDSTLFAAPTNPEPVTMVADGEVIAVAPGQKAMKVDIDIKPGSEINSIKLADQGAIPVAIFSTAVFDATTIDPLTCSLNSAAIRLRGKGYAASYEDVNGDGLLDMVVQMDRSGFVNTGDGFGSFEAKTKYGLYVKGSDGIRVIE